MTRDPHQPTSATGHRTLAAVILITIGFAGILTITALALLAIANGGPR